MAKKPSSIDKLPESIREEIGRLRMNGATLDQILAHLHTMTPDVPSRSALGRHALKIDALGERLRRSRTMAEALASGLGDAPESQAARLNIELLHNTMMELFLRDADGDEASDETGKAALLGNPEGLMMLAKAVQALASASKTNEDFIAAAEKRAADKARRQAAEAVDVVGKAKGLTAETLDAIKRGIFGAAA
jgi:hypothetical protein